MPAGPLALRCIQFDRIQRAQVRCVLNRAGIPRSGPGSLNSNPTIMSSITDFIPIPRTITGQAQGVSQQAPWSASLATSHPPHARYVTRR